MGHTVGNNAVTALYIPELENTVPASERASGVRPEVLPGARMPPDSQAVTTLLKRWRGGDSRALDELVPIIYSELQRWPGDVCIPNAPVTRYVPLRWFTRPICAW